MLARPVALVLTAALATSLSLAPGPAGAARPKPGAVYLGLERGLVPTEDGRTSTARMPDLRVSRSGRELGRNSSLVLYCGRDYTTAGTVRLRRPNGKAVRIGRDGRFP